MKPPSRKESIVNDTTVNEGLKHSCLRETAAIAFSQLGLLIVISLYLVGGCFLFNYLERGPQQAKLKEGLAKLHAVVNEAKGPSTTTAQSTTSTSTTTTSMPHQHAQNVSVALGVYSINLQLTSKIEELKRSGNQNERIQILSDLRSKMSGNSMPKDAIVVELWTKARVNFTKQILDIEYILGSSNIDLNDLTTDGLSTKQQPRISLHSVVKGVYMAIKAGWKPPNMPDTPASITPRGYGRPISSDYISGAGAHHDPWSYSGSLFFAITVITTIGYGNIVPATVEGKIATIFYGLFGIPIMFLFLANLGTLMADIVRLLYKHCCKLCYRIQKKDCKLKSPQSDSMASVATTPSNSRVNTPRTTRRTESSLAAVDEDADICVNRHVSFESISPFPALRETPGRLKSLQSKNAYHSSALRELVRRTVKPPITESIFISLAGTDSFLSKAMKIRKDSRNVHIPILVTFMLFFLYLTTGAIIFSHWESWVFTDAIYFVFVTISTIGFGDLIPGMADADVKTRHEKIVGASVYLLVGLAMVCMCFDLMQREIRRLSKGVAKRIGLRNKKK